MNILPKKQETMSPERAQEIAKIWLRQGDVIDRVTTTVTASRRSGKRTAPDQSETKSNLHITIPVAEGQNASDAQDAFWNNLGVSSKERAQFHNLLSDGKITPVGGYIYNAHDLVDILPLDVVERLANMSWAKANPELDRGGRSPEP